ncbi:MAG: DUF4349 domain-containing protein [Acholeplasmatales bacterium]|nr:MAG: DUF4349 domain-containing protein [Acholeplasmatales bacterium]
MSMSKKGIGLLVAAIIVILLAMIAMIFMGCSASYDEGRLPQDGQDGSGEQPLAHETTPERKIIYTVDMHFRVDDIDGAIADVRAMLAGDEWFDKESISSRYARFTARIRTDRLDAFIETLEQTYDRVDYERSARDVSLEYTNQTIRLLAIEAEIDALIAMMALAETFADMLLINERLNDLQIERQVVQGALNQFDSLVDYSEVHLYIYQRTIAERLPFGNRVITAFTDGVEALGAFLQGTVIVIAAVLPFAFFFGAVGGAGFILYRRFKKPRKPQAPKEEGDRLL